MWPSKSERNPRPFKRQTQIKVQSRSPIGALLFDKALTEVPAQYFDYNNDFLAENAAKLPENTGLNEYVIKLEKSK